MENVAYSREDKLTGREKLPVWREGPMASERSRRQKAERSLAKKYNTVAETLPTPTLTSTLEPPMSTCWRYALTLARDLAYIWPRCPHQYYLCATSSITTNLFAAQTSRRFLLSRKRGDVVIPHKLHLENRLRNRDSTTMALYDLHIAVGTRMHSFHSGFRSTRKRYAYCTIAQSAASNED
jgi:hypothetical protein